MKRWNNSSTLSAFFYLLYNKNMKSEKIEINGKIIPYLTNENKSKEMIIFVHGLNGSASFGKPLFKHFDCKVILMEQRGNNNLNLKPSRSIKKHLEDIKDVIKYFNKQEYKIWLMGESAGASYVSLLAYETNLSIEGIFVHSIPNKIANVMEAPKWVAFKSSFMTLISYLTNINYRYIASVNYHSLSNNRSLHRVAKLTDKTQYANVRETLSAWSANKKSWRNFKSDKIPQVPLYCFLGDEDIMVNIKKAKKNFLVTRNKEIIFIKGAKHILMYEKQFSQEIKRIKEVISDKEKKLN